MIDHRCNDLVCGCPKQLCVTCLKPATGYRAGEAYCSAHLHGDA